MLKKLIKKILGFFVKIKDLILNFFKSKSSQDSDALDSKSGEKMKEDTQQIIQQKPEVLAQSNNSSIPEVQPSTDNNSHSNKRTSPQNSIVSLITTTESPTAGNNSTPKQLQKESTSLENQSAKRNNRIIHSAQQVNNSNPSKELGTEQPARDEAKEDIHSAVQQPITTFEQGKSNTQPASKTKEDSPGVQPNNSFLHPKQQKEDSSGIQPNNSFLHPQQQEHDDVSSQGQSKKSSSDNAQCESLLPKDKRSLTQSGYIPVSKEENLPPSHEVKDPNNSSVVPSLLHSVYQIATRSFPILK